MSNVIQLEHPGLRAANERERMAHVEIAELRGWLATIANKDCFRGYETAQYALDESIRRYTHTHAENKCDLALVAEIESATRAQVLNQLEALLTSHGERHGNTHIDPAEVRRMIAGLREEAGR